MKLFNKIVEWFNTNHDLAYSLIRIILGVALFVRGLLLLSDPAAISEFAGQYKLYWWYSYITIIHIVTGFLLIFGLLTRIAGLLQIPILVGAVFFIHIKQGLVAEQQSLELAALLLSLLIVYSLFGSSSLSLDNYLAKRKSKLQNAKNSEASA